MNEMETQSVHFYDEAFVLMLFWRKIPWHIFYSLKFFNCLECDFDQSP